MSYNDHECSVHIQIGVCTRQTIGECREWEGESERASEFEKTFILRNNMEKKAKRKKTTNFVQFLRNGEAPQWCKHLAYIHIERRNWRKAINALRYQDSNYVHISTWNMPIFLLFCIETFVCFSFFVGISTIFDMVWGNHRVYLFIPCNILLQQFFSTFLGYIR